MANPFSAVRLPVFILAIATSLVFGVTRGDPTLRIVILDSRSYLDAVKVTNIASDKNKKLFEREASNTHKSILSSISSSSTAEPIHQYSELVNGFTAFLSDAEVSALKKDHRVSFVADDREVKLATTRSYTFLGLDNKSKGVWRRTRGSNAIVGVIDTGVSPENPSYSDKGMGAVPKKFKGVCSRGEDPAFKCNKKLIGARYLGKGYAAGTGKTLRTLVKECKDFLSPRDIDGHGTHTSSTAAGSVSTNVRIQGRYLGTAKGVAHNARLIMYKTFWCGKGASVADIAAAMDLGVADGVDVLSLSLGGSPDLPRGLTRDPSYYFAWKATLAGVPVVYAGGNDGPYWYTVSNTPPWVLTVGASSVDRRLSTRAIFGNGKAIQGSYVVSGGTPAWSRKKRYPLIFGEDAASKDTEAGVINAQYCQKNSLSPSKVKGKIVVCSYPQDKPAVTSAVLRSAKAAGLILYLADDSEGFDLDVLQFSFPTTLVSRTAGVALATYMVNTKNPTGYIEGTQVKVGGTAVEAPYVAKFSSAGPSGGTFSIIKPDISAPGVSIIASYPKKLASSTWQILSGTSMACPHVAGAVALLRSVYPKWSPSALYSAIMTTATHTSNRKRTIRMYSGKVATPFQLGSGNLNPNAALYPGLVYPISRAGYNNFFCSSISGINSSRSLFNVRNYCRTYPSAVARNLNVPSLVFQKVRHGTVAAAVRVLRNVGAAGTYTVSVKQPAGSVLRVSPTKLTFKKGATRSYRVWVRPTKASKFVSGATVSRYGGNNLETVRTTAHWTFGSITWSDGKGHRVRINVALNAK